MLTRSDKGAIGQVFYIGNVYHTRTILADDFIHTIAVNFLEDLDLVVEIDKKDILKDINGIPWVGIASLNQYKAASVSNHGRFEKTVTIETK
ncbi:hypothetical protein D3C85_1739920 [compost metagenome]